ncbi:MAG TPA: flagellar biosynthesis protein FlhB [Alphaproteobacteria bacterium]
MAEEEEDDKTEDASAKKMNEAREKGQVALSRELNSWVVMAAGAFLVATVLGRFSEDLARKLKNFIAAPHSIVLDGGGAHALLFDLMITIGPYLLVPLCVIMLAGILAPLAQVGPLLTWAKLEPKFSKLNPLPGFKRLVGMQSLVELAKSIAKLSIIGGATTVILRPYVENGEGLIGQDLGIILGILRQEIVQLFIVTLSITFVLAVGDYVYQRYQLNKSLRMSKQEIKDEYKQAEGDPVVKGKIKQMRAQKARQRMMARVPDASVIITNPTHYAVALEYNREKMNAPVVTAKGIDNLALRIRALAEEHNVPIVENPPLARGLHASMEIDDEISEEHYKAVAEVISYVYSLKGRR